MKMKNIIYLRRSFFRILLFIACSIPLFGQGTYYNGLDTSKSTFVTDLHNLIYPHTKLSYYTTDVAEYASRDTSSGQKYVVCVYSGEKYIHTPPFAWGTYSREHTWCHSWMPTYPSESGPEYSDQHHLFPTNQNKANGVRNNHPLGIVVQVSSSYLEGKYGKNSRGNNVYEPRNSHKGDAARALLYMALCYHGVNGNDWSFQTLNTVKLPALGEDSMDVAILRQWHQQDPPDTWEKALNDSVYKYQGNRNPFVDHPEFVNLINFHTMTRATTGALAAEPTNYPTNFIIAVATDSSLQLSWTDAAAGSQVPSAYLILAQTTDSFTPPTDGTLYTDDQNLGDGSAAVNVQYSAGNTYTFSGLTSGTTYYFHMYSYNGSGSTCNYKTNGTVPAVSGATFGLVNTGAIPITSMSFSYSQNFNSLAMSGSSNVWKDDSTLAGWYSNRTVYLSDIGSSTTGGIHSYGSLSASERALGSIGSSSAATVYYGVRFVNRTSIHITEMNITYTGEQWRDGGNTTQHTLSVQYQIGAISLTSGAWTDIPSLQFTGPVASATATYLDGNLPANRQTLTYTLTADIDNGVEIWFRWVDPNDAGNDHGLAIDDFSFYPVSGALPVELSKFTATINRNTAFLRWRTETEVDNLGFEVERRKADESMSLGANNSTQQLSGSATQWLKIGFVPGNGMSNSPKEYSFEDKNLNPGIYIYRLKQIDTDGRFKYSGSAEVDAGVSAKVFQMLNNYPNPFNPETEIQFSVPEDGIATLKVYNVLGQEVAVLFNGLAKAGHYHAATFNAGNLASGVYFSRLEYRGRSLTQRMLLTK